MSDTADAGALAQEFVGQAIVQTTVARASTSNQAARRLAAIYGELRMLGTVGLRELSALVSHDHEGVRLWAAAYGLELLPEISEPVLQALADGLPGPIRASAATTLREWRSNRMKFP